MIFILKDHKYSIPQVGDEVLPIKVKKHGKKKVNISHKMVVDSVYDFRTPINTIVKMVRCGTKTFPVHRVVKSSEALIRLKGSSEGRHIEEFANLPKPVKVKPNPYRKNPLAKFIRECILDGLTLVEAKEEWRASWEPRSNFDSVWKDISLKLKNNS
jgi:hypothetical protein